MPRPPYMNFPFPFYRNLSGIQPPFQPIPEAKVNKTLNNSSTSISNNHIPNIENKEENNRGFKSKNKSNKYADDYLFDLFGLKIYSDDVLLVSLIYFLYSEGVKDDGLFLVLILLLLS